MVRITSIILLIFANCVLIFSAETAKNETDNDLRLFFISSVMLEYAKGNAKEPELGIFMGERRFASYSEKKFVENFDYHAGKGMIYWTSPRIGFWTNQAKLYSVPWNYDFNCYDETGKKNPRCYIYHKDKYYNRYDKIKLLRTVDNWNPRSLAVDYIGDKLYVVDTSQRAVNVFNLNGKNKATIFENEPLIPNDVALDPPKGLMFVTAVDIRTGMKQIYKVNMDGTAPRIIVENVEILTNFTVREKSAFTLDTIKNRIYFANFGKEIIEQVDYDGKGRLTVAKVKYFPLSVSVHKDTLYWSDSYTSSSVVYMCLTEEFCKIWSCKLDASGACDANSTENINSASMLSFGTHAVKVVDRRLQLPIPNPCGTENGGCQHHCLLKSSGEGGQSPSFGCVCNDGYHLTSDLKNCTRKKKNYTYADYLIPENTNFTLLSSPPDNDISFIPWHMAARIWYSGAERILHRMPFHYFQVDDDKQLVATEYTPIDSYNGDRTFDFTMAFGGLGTLETYVDKSDSWSNSINGSYTAKALAYDWITQILYYVRVYSDEGSDKADLLYLRYDKSDKVKYSYYSPKYKDEFLAKVELPVSMVVHPYRGYLYLATFNGSIIRMNTDGLGELRIPNVNNSYVLGIDLTADKLYWVDTDGYINYADLDGSNPQRLDNVKMSDINFLHVYSKFVYAKSSLKKHVWRFDKITGKDAGYISIDEINFFRSTVGIRVSTRDAQEVDVDHPCAVKNGGCEMFCFGVPETGKSSGLTRKCSCGQNKKLLEDGLKCKLPLDETSTTTEKDEVEEIIDEEDDDADFDI